MRCFLKKLLSNFRKHPGKDPQRNFISAMTRGVIRTLFRFLYQNFFAKVVNDFLVSIVFENISIIETARVLDTSLTFQQAKVNGIEGSKTELFWLKVKHETSTEAYVEPSTISKMELFCEYNQRLNAVNCFRKKASSQIFDWVLNTYFTCDEFLFSRTETASVLWEKNILFKDVCNQCFT